MPSNSSGACDRDHRIVEVTRSRQEACLGLQPFTDDASALLTVVRPGFREAVIGNFIALDAERVADPLAMYLADIYTVTGSLAGVPGISVHDAKWSSDQVRERIANKVTAAER